MIQSFLPLLLVVASTLLQSERAKESAEQPYDDAEAYAVYSAIPARRLDDARYSRQALGD